MPPAPGPGRDRAARARARRPDRTPPREPGLPCYEAASLPFVAGSHHPRPFMNRRRRRRIARQGQDHQQISGPRLHRAGQLRPCPRPAAQGRLGPARRRFRHGLGSRRRGREAPRRDRQGRIKGADKLYPRDRPGPRGRGDLLARRASCCAQQEGAEGRRRQARHLQRNHQAGGAGSVRAIRATSTSKLVDAYLARRALDYLVGFTLSPVLWRKLPGSRSAGRVQSVALRLICEREAEIEVFKRARILDGRSRCSGTAARRDASAPASRISTASKLDKFDLKTEAERAERRRAEIERHGLSPSPRSRDAGPAQPAAALHHLDPAAGSLAQTGLRRHQTHAHRPAASMRASTSAAKRSASSPICEPTACTLAQRGDRQTRAA